MLRMSPVESMYSVVQLIISSGVAHLPNKLQNVEFIFVVTSVLNVGFVAAAGSATVLLDVVVLTLVVVATVLLGVVVATVLPDTVVLLSHVGAPILPGVVLSSIKKLVMTMYHASIPHHT